jgi:hypothetical protein
MFCCSYNAAKLNDNGGKSRAAETLKQEERDETNGTDRTDRRAELREDYAFLVWAEVAAPLARSSATYCAGCGFGFGLGKTTVNVPAR